MTTLYNKIDLLPGVGEKRAAHYHKMGIDTAWDLLNHMPRTYLDFTQTVCIADAPIGEPCAIYGEVVEKLPEQRIRGGLTLYKVVLCDDEQALVLTFFNTPYTYRSMQVGQRYYVYGKVTGGMLRKEMSSPQVQADDGRAVLLLPIYPQTTGLTSAMMRTNVRSALQLLEDSMETLPPWVMEQYDLMTLCEAMRQIHFPKSQADMQRARRRLAFEELLKYQVGTTMLRARMQVKTAYAMQPNVSLDAFIAALPFALTGAQQRAIADIEKDLCGAVPMNRLLQGDVGSGKTVVAAAAIVYAVRNGCQSVLMAPTEILAQQHFHTLTAFLQSIGIQPVLLNGSLTAKEKRQIRSQIADGSAMVIVGTHAVIQKDTVFARLGLVITDEQHRFGVAQRRALAEKGGHPHKLVMSATPIPRTLALILYGDLDITVLDEAPKGRLPIRTYAVTGRKREDAYGFLRQHLDAGEQAYIVCAMIEESEQMELVQAAEQYAKELQTGAFAAYRVGLLHGRMKPQEKERIMRQMKAHEIDVLVCTTVVEVGVDVPNATIILIENAERFGMAQLHQLRGRVGRGTQQSHCILVTDSTNEESKDRLRELCRTTNGFEIAEADLKRRGPGDFFGSAQHGMPPMMQAALCNDMPLVKETQAAAGQLLEQDPDLRSSDCAALRLAILEMFAKNGENGLN